MHGLRWSAGRGLGLSQGLSTHRPDSGCWLRPLLGLHMDTSREILHMAWNSSQWMVLACGRQNSKMHPPTHTFSTLILGL